MSLYVFVLTAMAIVAGPKHVEPWLAQAITFAVQTDGAPKGWSPELAAAALLVSAWQEGAFCYRCRRGDGGHSVTTFQIKTRSEAQARALESNDALAARVALKIIRDGAAICPSHELAPYTGGCNVPVARAVSDRRMRAARALAAP